MPLSEMSNARKRFPRILKSDSSRSGRFRSFFGGFGRQAFREVSYVAFATPRKAKFICADCYILWIFFKPPIELMKTEDPDIDDVVIQNDVESGIDTSVIEWEDIAYSALRITKKDVLVGFFVFTKYALHLSILRG